MTEPMTNDQALEELRKLMAVNDNVPMLSIGPLGAGYAVYDNNTLEFGGKMIASAPTVAEAVQKAKEVLEK